MTTVTPSDVAGRVAPRSGVDLDDVDGEAKPVVDVVESAPRDRRRERLAKSPHIGTGVPVLGLTGINGAGKTLLAATLAIHDIAAGRPVYSTVDIHTPWGDSQRIRSLRQLISLPEPSTICLDEIAVILPASSTHLPHDFNILLQTVRHHRHTIIWTAPTWMAAHNKLRASTQGLINVAPFMRRHDPFNPWATPRLVLAGLMDTSQGKVDETPTKVMRRRIYAPKQLAGWGAYDTHADTPFIGARGRSGTCMDCGGSLPPLKHSRELHERLGVPWYDD